MGQYRGASLSLPRPERKRLASPGGSAAGSGTFPQLHPSQTASLCLLSGEALKAARAGAGCLYGAGHEAKSAPGRSTRAQATLCQQPLAYLPPWLFAFGEAPAGWGWGRPGSQSLEAGRALRPPRPFHLHRLLAAPGTAAACPRSLDPRLAPTWVPSRDHRHCARPQATGDLLLARPSPQALGPGPCGRKRRVGGGSPRPRRLHRSRPFSSAGSQVWEL